MENKENWKLKSLTVEFKDWGEFKNKYSGQIRFENDKSESFQFNLTPELVQPFIDLMAKQIVETANGLGNKLIESLGLKENEKEI